MFKRAVDEVTVVLMYQSKKIAALQSPALIAENLFERRAAIPDCSVEFEHGDNIERIFNEGRKYSSLRVRASTARFRSVA